MENYSWKLELQILQLAIMNNTNHKNAKRHIKSEYFYSPMNKEIYHKIIELDNPSLSSLLSKLTKDELRHYKTDLPKLADNIIPMIYNLKELYKRREIETIINICYDYLEQAKGSTEIINFARHNLIDLVEDKDIDTAETSIEFMKYIEKIKNKEIKFHFTGYRSLDNYIYGFGSNDLVVIGARPSVGKTSLALNIMNFQSEKMKLHIKFYSIEMEKNSVLINLLGITKGINASKYYKGELNENEIAHIQDYLTRYSSEKLEIIDTHSHIDEICTDIEMSEADIFYIDYLQIISNKHTNIFDRTTYNMRRLKSLQKKINKPIVVISQAKRPVSKKDKSTKEDLKGSGSIEEEATKIIMINSYYSTYLNMEQYTLSVEKNKQGAIGDVDINFDKERFRFYE